jgi:hypothetical protein
MHLLMLIIPSNFQKILKENDAGQELFNFEEC